MPASNHTPVCLNHMARRLEEHFFVVSLFGRLKMMKIDQKTCVSIVFSLMQTRVGCVGMYIWENQGGQRLASRIVYHYCCFGFVL